MRRKCLLAVAPVAGVTFMIVLMMPGLVVAQNVTESALKAAFIHNFARFTTWPDEWPTSEPFVICVLGDAVRDALERDLESLVARTDMPRGAS